MQLLGWYASPYVRKCRVTVAELGLDGTVAFLPAKVGSEEIKAANPVMKMPTLVLDSGESIFDSRMIMRYLNQHAAGSLYADGDWDQVRRESQAEGMIDAAMLLRDELFARPEASRWDEYIEDQFGKISSVLDATEKEASKLEHLDAVAIATGCGLGYLDFRYPDLNWRNKRPNLAGWFDTFNARPSMQGTIPALV